MQFVCKIRISKLFKNRSLQNESSKNDISFSPFEKRASRWILKDMKFAWFSSWAPKFLPTGWRKVLLKKSLELFKSGKTMVSQTSRIFTEIEIIVFFWPKLLFFGGKALPLSFESNVALFFSFPFFSQTFLVECHHLVNKLLFLLSTKKARCFEVDAEINFGRWSPFFVFQKNGLRVGF